MTYFQAIVLGIIQGLTEFLPVSSDGHLELGRVLLGMPDQENLLFVVVVHGATVLSTIVVFYSEIVKLLRDAFRFQMNDSVIYLVKIVISMIPVLIVGVFFEKKVEQTFSSNLVLIGSMLLLTGTFLFFSYIQKNNSKDVGFGHALVMGIAQAFAVLPGLSRSATTISSGLMMGCDREQVTRFSFLMVLVPIIGVNFLKLFSLTQPNNTAIDVSVLAVGFLAAFITGLFACKTMITVVKKSGLVWFAVYCYFVGIISLVSGL